MLEVLESAVEAKFFVLPGSLELGEELSPEEPAQYANGEKEPIPTAHPAVFISAQASAGNDAMEVGVVMEVLAPGVQDGEAGDLRSEMVRVSAQGQQCLGNGTKEHPVDDATILERQWSELLRNGEHDVEVLDVEQFLLARFEPVCSSRRLTLWAMPVAARVVDRHLVTAALTPLEMTPESRRPALCEIVQYPSLLLRRAVALQIRRTVFSDDIGHFRPMSAHFFFGVVRLSFSRSAISRRDGWAPTAM
jgi:cytochrome c-type biogenesis protein CcmH/NrfF